MKIWLDPTPHIQFNANGTVFSDCEDDCDSECPGGENSLKECSECSDGTCQGYASRCARYMILFQEDTDVLYQELFQQVTLLHIQALAQEQRLICAPTGSGSIAVVDNEAWGVLEQFSTPTCIQQLLHSHPDWTPARVKDTVATFYRLGFLERLTSRRRAVPDASTMLSAWIHVTNACNLRCDYCYLEKTSEHMADDTSRRAVDAIFRSAVKNGYTRVRLRYAGGEASLHIAHVLAIHDYAATQAQQHSLQFNGTLMTNGVFLSQQTIQALRARNITVTLSLDGIGSDNDQQRPFLNGRGSFKLVDRTITRLLANGVIPNITVTVSRRNLDGLPALIEYILERKMPFSLNYYRENQYAAHLDDLQFEEEQMISAMQALFIRIEQILPRYPLLNSLIDKASMNSQHQYPCSVGRNYIVIDQHGGVTKCHANITNTVTTIDVDDPLRVIRDDRSGIQAYSVDEKEGCRSCDWRYWCNGGCPMLTYRITGRNDVKSPNCNIYKALFPQALRLEALRLLTYTSPIVV